MGILMTDEKIEQPIIIPETPLGAANFVVRYYGTFDEEGRAIAFYTNEIYPPENELARSSKIPLEAVEITKEVWEELLAKQTGAVYRDGQVVDVPYPYIPPPPPSPIEAIEKAIESLAKDIQELKRELRGRR
jgi:hypothetical protein